MKRFRRIKRVFTRTQSDPTPGVLAPGSGTRRASTIPGATGPKKQGVTLTITPTPRALTLWEQALRRLRPEDTAGVDFDANGKPPVILQDLIRATQQKKTEIDAKRWVYHNSSGEEVSYADNFLTRLNKYVAIADTVMQHNAQVVAVVWAGFRILLQVSGHFSSEVMEETR